MLVANIHNTKRRMLYVKKGVKKVLYYLLDTNQPVSIEKVATSLGLSKRTLYYDINNLNSVLKANNLGTVQNNKGFIFLDEQQKKDIYAANHQLVSIYDQRIKKLYIICLLLFPQQPIHLEAIQERLMVSRRSILRELQQVKEFIKNYELTLISDKSLGYTINGDLQNKQELYLLSLSSCFRAANYRFFNIFPVENIDNYLNKFLNVLDKLSIRVKERELLVIVHFYFTMVNHENNKEIIYPEIIDSEIKNSEEYHIVKSYFSAKEHDLIYLTLLIISLTNKYKVIDNINHNFNFRQLATSLVNEFEGLTMRHLIDKKELICSLVQHMEFSYILYQYSIPRFNWAYDHDNVSDELTQIINITKTCFFNLKKEFPYPLLKSEISFLSSYLISSLPYDRNTSFTVNILVFHHYNNALYLYLKKQIEEVYSNVKILKAAKFSHIDEIISNNDIDIVLTTIPIDVDCINFDIPPVLTDLKKEDLLSAVIDILILKISKKL